METMCPCQSGEELNNCCEPFIKLAKKPPTAEALMRSRYSAFALGEVEYLAKTLAPESRGDFDYKATKEWAENSEWKGLKIISTVKGEAGDKSGTVEFVATYSKDGETQEHREVAQFRKDKDGQWLFVDGDERHHETYVREEPKLGRNDPCHCGSGKKFKKCHGGAEL